MFEIKIRSQVISDNFDHRLVLPDRMLNKTSRDRLWGMVFNNRKKLKEASDALFKSTTISELPRKVSRAIEPEAMVGYLLWSNESRYVIFDENLGFNYQSWISLIFSCQERVLKKLAIPGDQTLKIDLRLSQYDINLDEKVTKDSTFLRCLSVYTLEAPYNALDFDDKDLADFFINTALCEIGDLDFIIDFFDKCPWLKPRNNIFYDGAKEARAELEDELHEQTLDSFILDNVSQIESFVSRGRRVKLNSLTNIAQIVDSFTTDKAFGLPLKISECITDEQKSLVEFICSAIDQATSVPAMKEMPSWQACRDVAAKLVEPFHLPTLTPEILSVLKSYCERRGSYTEAMLEYPEEFMKALASFKQLKAEVAAEAAKEDSDIDVLCAKSDELKQASVRLSVSAEKVGTVFMEILQGFVEVRDKLEAIMAKPKELEALDAPVAAPEAAPSSEHAELAKANEKLEQQYAVLHEQALTIRTKNEELSSQLDEAKKENHTLKSRLGFDPSRSKDDIRPLAVDNATLMALVTQNRKVSPLEILNFFQAMAPDRLELLPSAIETAMDADNFSLPYRLSDLIEKLVFGYLDSITAGIPDSEARKVFGKNYAAKESEGVTQNKRLRAMREFTYNGEKSMFSQHLSIGRNVGTQFAIRLYFKIIDGKVIIAYCGKHMEAMQTN